MCGGLWESSQSLKQWDKGVHYNMWGEVDLVSAGIPNFMVKLVL